MKLQEFLILVSILFQISVSGVRAEKRSVKKELINTAAVVEIEEPKETKEFLNVSTPHTILLEQHNISSLPSLINQTSIKSNVHYENDLPDSFKTGFYILIGTGILGLCFVIYKAFSLKQSRAERRYGVQGDRSAQELTPLPMSIDDDSENEDQTIFQQTARR